MFKYFITAHICFILGIVLGVITFVPGELLWIYPTVLAVIKYITAGIGVAFCFGAYMFFSYLYRKIQMDKLVTQYENEKESRDSQLTEEKNRSGQR